MDQYDAYRFADSGVDPYRLQYGSPGAIPNTPSTSAWGHFVNPKLTGNSGTNAVLGTAAKMSLAVPAFAPAAAVVGAFSKRKAKKKKADIERTRAAEVERWRNETYNRMVQELQQAAGIDAVQDLGGELRNALWAGGVLGDPDAIQNAMMMYQQRYRDYMIGRQQANQARQVEAMFADPMRIQQREQRLAAERDLGKSQIVDAYRLGNIQNAQAQARRGMAGGSTDIEARGALARNRNTAMLGLESGLLEKARQYRLQDEAQKQQLLGMIYGEDPMSAQQFAAAMQGIQRHGEAFREQAATQAQIGQVNQAAAMGYSQAFGGALSSAAPAVQIYASKGGQ